MRTALHRFCLNVGWLYTRLVASNSLSHEDAPETPSDDERPTEESSLIQRKPKTTLSDSIEEFMSMCVLPEPSIAVLLTVVRALMLLCEQGAASSDQATRAAGSAQADNARAATERTLPDQVVPFHLDQHAEDLG